MPASESLFRCQDTVDCAFLVCSTTSPNVHRSCSSMKNTICLATLFLTRPRICDSDVGIPRGQYLVLLPSCLSTFTLCDLSRIFRWYWSPPFVKVVSLRSSLYLIPGFFSICFTIGEILSTLQVHYLSTLKTPSPNSANMTNKKV